jgi:hypothetical protein
MRRKDKNLLNLVKKKKKGGFVPFHGKVAGGTARRRADRYQGGGAVSDKADGEPESPNTPNAPVGGAVRQKFQRGGDTDTGDDESPPNYKAGGVLSAKQRQALPSSSFALPGKGKGPKGAGAGSYPIPDKSHARNALARVSQHGSPAEKATVRAKVKSKFPDIGQS